MPVIAGRCDSRVDEIDRAHRAAPVVVGRFERDRPRRAVRLAPARAARCRCRRATRRSRGMATAKRRGCPMRGGRRSCPACPACSRRGRARAFDEAVRTRRDDGEGQRPRACDRRRDREGRGRVVRAALAGAVRGGRGSGGGRGARARRRSCDAPVSVQPAWRGALPGCRSRWARSSAGKRRARPAGRAHRRFACAPPEKSSGTIPSPFSCRDSGAAPDRIVGVRGCPRQLAMCVRRALAGIGARCGARFAAR
ncbi:putative sensor histidine kinase [Burkholderia humptydooensis]|nr:putative sensor histidine kinase [Burkholderia sp. 2002721687]